MAQSSARRRSIRLKDYDYTKPGAYFVTLCTHERVCLFGTVAGGEMRLNEYGRKAADWWLWLAERYPYVRLDEWVVMPNHLHGIVVITDDHADGGRGGSRTAPTGPRDIHTVTHDVLTGPRAGAGDLRIGSVKRKPLGRLIGAFKTVSTKHVNDIRSTPGAKLWQRNYYEHVIRDDPSLHRIREYIANNPPRWTLDREGPARLRERRSSTLGDKP